MITNGQGSGRKGSRTSDHLMIIRFLIDKYVNVAGKKLFACFFDLRKAFDTVPRLLLFFTILKQYKVGGHFLKVLQEMYTNNQVFVKLPEGLCQPFLTSVGVLQGEVNSPLLFNLFVNKISEIFDQSCDPVQINRTDQSFLLWADDLVVFSQSAAGLQSAIDEVSAFYASLGLQINKSKTKILIFNKSGKVLKNYRFFLADDQLEVSDSYQYLGVRLAHLAVSHKLLQSCAVRPEKPGFLSVMFCTRTSVCLCPGLSNCLIALFHRWLCMHVSFGCQMSCLKNRLETKLFCYLFLIASKLRPLIRCVASFYYLYTRKPVN